MAEDQMDIDKDIEDFENDLMDIDTRDDNALSSLHRHSQIPPNHRHTIAPYQATQYQPIPPQFLLPRGLPPSHPAPTFIPTPLEEARQRLPIKAYLRISSELFPDGFHDNSTASSPTPPPSLPAGMATGTENSAPVGAAAPGRPFYDREALELAQMLKQREKIASTLATIEDKIYEKETDYLEDTPNGNIVMGFEGYTKGTGMCFPRCCEEGLMKETGCKRSKEEGMERLRC